MGRFPHPYKKMFHSPFSSPTEVGSRISKLGKHKRKMEYLKSLNIDNYAFRERSGRGERIQMVLQHESKAIINSKKIHKTHKSLRGINRKHQEFADEERQKKKYMNHQTPF